MVCALGLVFVMSALMINLLEGLVLPAGEWDARAWGNDLWKGGAAAAVIVWCAQLSTETWLALPASTGGVEAGLSGATVAVAAVIGSVGAGSIWGQGAETRLPGWKWRGGKHDLYLWAVLAEAGGFLAWAAATAALVTLGTSPLGYLAMAVLARLVLETRNGLVLARLASARQASPLSRPEPALGAAESTANPGESDAP
jgi:hypothetical protein